MTFKVLNIISNAPSRNSKRENLRKQTSLQVVKIPISLDPSEYFDNIRGYDIKNILNDGHKITITGCQISLTYPFEKNTYPIHTQITINNIPFTYL